MFRAVNTESESEKRRCIIERQKIHNLYVSSSKSLNIDRFLSYNVSFDQNQSLYDNAKSSLLFSLVFKKRTEQLMNIVEKYNILESKLAFFEVIRAYIEKSNFVLAKKLLNLAKAKRWFCNEYFELRNDIKTKYFTGDVTKKKKTFEDFL